MIELTPEQLRVVQEGKPVCVSDPSTPYPLVVMRADVYERIAGGAAGRALVQEITREVLERRKDAYQGLT